MTTLNNLQGLRFLAFILIYLNHAYGLISTGKIFDYGARGVELFFILSGYLIAYGFVSRNHGNVDSSWKACFSYLINKLKKFYFLHVLTFLIAAYVISFIKPSYTNMLRDAFLSITLLKSWYRPAMFSFNGATWFLSTMLFCWFLVPKINGLFKNRKRTVLLISFFILYLLSMTIDELVFKAGYPLPEAISLYVFPPYRLIHFILGYLGYFLLRDLDKNSLGGSFNLSLLQLVSLVGTIYVYIALDKTFVYTQFILFDIILIHLLSINGGIFDILFGNKVFTHLGNISFELYILHGEFLSLGKLYLLPLGINKIMLFILIFIVTYLLSEFFHLRKVHKFITNKIWSLGKSQ